MERRKALSVAATGALVFSTGLVAAVSIGGFHILGFRPHPGNTAVAGATTTIADPLCTTTTITVAASALPPDPATVPTAATPAPPPPAGCTASTTIAPIAVTVPIASPPVTCASGADPATCP